MSKKMFFILVIFLSINIYSTSQKKNVVGSHEMVQNVYAEDHSVQDNKPTSEPNPTSSPELTSTPTADPQATPEVTTPQPTNSQSDQSQDKPPQPPSDNNSNDSTDNSDDNSQNHDSFISSVTDDTPPPSSSDPITHTLSGLLSKVINPPHEFDYTGSLNNFYNTPKMSSQETAFLLVISAIFTTTGVSLLIFPYTNHAHWSERKHFNPMDSFSYDV